jgi:hypothetical protein
VVFTEKKYIYTYIDIYILKEIVAFTEKKKYIYIHTHLHTHP